MSHWRFSPKIFGELFRLGAPSSARAACNLFYWVVAVKLVSHLGGDFVLVLSYGSALWFPLRALTSALSQGSLSLFSFFLGEESLATLWKSFRSALLLLLIIFLILGVPLITFVLKNELR